jgi:hypothetical protein
MSEETLLERIRRAEDAIKRLQSGEIPSDTITTGTGHGHNVRIQARLGGRGGQDATDADRPVARYPHLEFQAIVGDGSSAIIPKPEVRVSHDGITSNPIQQTLTPSSFATVDQLSVLSRQIAQAAQSGQRFIHVYEYPRQEGAVTLSTSWSEWNHVHMLFQGGFSIFPASTLHRISMWASATTDSASVRCYDSTNGATIWTVTGITSSAFYTTTSVSNLPTSDAVFRHDAQSSAGTPNLSINWLSWWAII